MSISKFLGLPVILRLASMARNLKSLVTSLFYFFWIAPVSIAYRPGDIVPMSKMGQYHSVKSLNPKTLNPKSSLFLSLLIFLSFCCNLSVENGLVRCHWSPMPNLRCRSWGMHASFIFSSISLSLSLEISPTFLCWFLGNSLIFSCYFVGFDSNNETHWLHRGWSV